MFGKPKHADAPPASTGRSASESAEIQGGGLVQAIVTSLEPITYYLFLNDVYVPQVEIESLSVDIEAPSSNSPTGVVRATLCRYVTSVAGEKTLQHNELFPCMLEVVALGKRVSLTCQNPHSFDGLWIDLGLRPDGSANSITGGVHSINLVVSDDLLEADLVWEDGASEKLLPH